MGRGRYRKAAQQLGLDTGSPMILGALDLMAGDIENGHLLVPGRPRRRMGRPAASDT